MVFMNQMNFVSITGGWVLMMQLLLWQPMCSYFGITKVAYAKEIEIDAYHQDGAPASSCPSNTGTAAVDPSTLTDTIELRKMMRIASETGNHGKVIDILNRLISLEPENERNFFQRHKSYLHNLRYDDAILDLTTALDLRHGYKQALAQRAKIYLMAGYCEDSVKDYITLRDIDPKHSDLKEGLSHSQSCVKAYADADRLFKKKEYLGARELYDDILAHTKANQIPILLQRTLCSQNLKEWNDMVFDAGRMLSLEPDSIQALTLRGYGFYNLGDTETAISHFRKALHFDPENVECKDMYQKLRNIAKVETKGQEMLELKDYKSASEAFLEAASLAGDSYHVAALLVLKAARSQCKMEEWKECVKTAESAITFNKKLLDAYMLVGEAYMSLEKYQDAVRAYTNAKQIAGGGPEVDRKLRNAEVALAQSKKIDYYKILEVKRSAQTTTAEIKKSYKRLALVWHPDKHAGKTEEEIAEAEEKFQKVAEAYEVLSSTELRRKYDNGEEVFENQGPGHGGRQHFHHQGFHGYQHRRTYYHYRY